MMIRVPAATRLAGAAIALSLITVGCTSTPSVQTGPNAEVTADGLVRVDNSSMQNSWVKPDINLAGYNQILPRSAGVTYRAVRGGGGTSVGNSRRSEFPISEADRERFERQVGEIFLEELGNSTKYTLTDKPGPGVLIVNGGLIDVVSQVPRESAGRSNVYVSSVGEATLFLELIDSESGEVLARSVDRRAAERAGGNQLVRGNSASATGEVRRLMRRWAVQLREALDTMADKEFAMPVSGG